LQLPADIFRVVIPAVSESAEVVFLLAISPHSSLPTFDFSLQGTVRFAISRRARVDTVS
jgi:hypothetical protein